jgi:very-short-patch-repair endonuclease
MSLIKKCDETRKLCVNENCIVCFNKSFKSLEINISLTDDSINLRQISKFSNKKTEFKCNECLHLFLARYAELSSGCGCPYCAIPSKKLCEDIECQKCLERSFASHEKSIYWNLEKNKIEPRFVLKNANSKFWFTCNICLHNFEIAPHSINLLDSFCSYCARKSLCINIDCISCFNNSFASHPQVYKFSEENKKKPRDIFLRSDDKYIFNCEICDHEFNSRIADFKTDTSNCPYCAKKVLCENNDCLFCFNNSFASYEKSLYFSNKNNIETNKIFKSSETKYIFNCNECDNEFISSPHNISLGRWCSICKYKTEKILYNWLCDKYMKENIKTQFIIKKNENKLRYDFLIKNKNILIELDGNQHFKQVMNWASPEHNLDNDVNKINYALEKKYTIIHLLQIDVYNNKNNWNTKLINCIKEYDIPQIIIIDNNNIYKNHINNIKDIDNLILVS